MLPKQVSHSDQLVLVDLRGGGLEQAAQLLALTVGQALDDRLFQFGNPLSRVPVVVRVLEGAPFLQAQGMSGDVLAGFQIVNV